MARLPHIWTAEGGAKDSHNWGEILNKFLLVSHNEDGTLRVPPEAVSRPPFGMKKVKNLYVDPATVRLVVEYDDEEGE